MSKCRFGQPKYWGVQFMWMSSHCHQVLHKCCQNEKLKPNTFVRGTSLSVSKLTWNEGRDFKTRSNANQSCSDFCPLRHSMEWQICRTNEFDFLILWKSIFPPKKFCNVASCMTPITTSFLKMGQSRPLFVYFRPFLITISIIQIEKA